MNRIAAQGLIAETMTGKRIIVLTHARATRETLGYFAPHLPEMADVRRWGDGTSIWLDEGATLQILTPAGMRGRTADVVYVDTDITALGLDDLDLYQSAHTAVLGSTHGEVIRA